MELQITILIYICFSFTNGFAYKYEEGVTLTPYQLMDPTIYRFFYCYILWLKVNISGE